MIAFYSDFVIAVLISAGLIILHVSWNLDNNTMAEKKIAAIYEALDNGMQNVVRESPRFI